MSAHKFRPEATNNGHYFSDCSCGWNGGVYPSRAAASVAFHAHRDGTTIPEPVQPIVLFGPPAGGQSVSS